MFRAEKEGVVSLQIRPSEEEALDLVGKLVIKARHEAARQVRLALEDGYKRLLAPYHGDGNTPEVKKRSDEEAIRVFAENLRELLMAPPLGAKRVLALDPVSAQAQSWSALMLRESYSITTQFIPRNLKEWPSRPVQR